MHLVICVAMVSVLVCMGLGVCVSLRLGLSWQLFGFTCCSRPLTPAVVSFVPHLSGGTMDKGTTVSHWHTHREDCCQNRCKCVRILKKFQKLNLQYPGPSWRPSKIKNKKHRSSSWFSMTKNTSKIRFKKYLKILVLRVSSKIVQTIVLFFN